MSHGYSVSYQEDVEVAAMTVMVRETPSLRCRRVEGFGQAAKPDAPQPQGLDGFDQLLHRSCQPVELPHDQRVARTPVLRSAGFSCYPLYGRGGERGADTRCPISVGAGASQQWVYEFTTMVVSVVARQFCGIGYLAKISVARLSALSAATSGVMPLATMSFHAT
jgi:hypothetical protein